MVPSADVCGRRFRVNMNDFYRSIRRNTIVVVLASGCCCLTGYGFAQEAPPDLNLDDYRIVGRDTRVFAIEGDRMSTVAFRPDVIALQPEERKIEASEGLIGNDERLQREERFNVERGLYLRAVGFSGSNTVADVWGKASLDVGSNAGTIELETRMAEENTPFNTAPSVQSLDAVGYFGESVTRLSAGFGFSAENDELGGKRFRDIDRETSRYRANAVLTTRLGRWDTRGAVTIDGGSFKDNDLPYDDSELNIGGFLSLTGDVYDITVVSDTKSQSMKYGDDEGYIVSTGLRGNMLVTNSLGIRLGANLYVSSAAGADTDTRLAPDAGLDWALGNSMYFKANYRPEVVAYSHGDLYGLNGLVLPSSMLFEYRSIALDGELGWRFSEGSLLAASVFRTDAEDALVFTSIGDCFGIVGGAEIETTGGRVRVKYDRDGAWGLDGLLTVRDASTADGDDVPYVPAFEASVRGTIAAWHSWTFHGTLNVVGEHAVMAGAPGKEDGFLTIGCGVERDFFDFFSVYFDLRNLTNAEGTWWTSRYEIPGAGMYGGLKLRL